MKRVSRRRPSLGPSNSGTVTLGLGFAAITLGPMALGVCGCTAFSMAAAAMVLLCALLVGNSTYGALTGERERKTLDSLRLTQWNEYQIIWSKLQPEMHLLGRLLLALAPSVVVASLFSDAGLGAALGAILVAINAAVFASISGIYLSSVFDTTSRAVVAGWVGKALWLLLTPILDMVVGAITVTHHPIPIFTSLNPLAQVGLLAVPEAVPSAGLGLIAYALVANFTLMGLMLLAAAVRLRNGLTCSAGLNDRQVHRFYKRGWGPTWLQNVVPGLKSNPFFVREMTAQVRSGAGRWPGYAVFALLFLAPFLYAQSWALKDAIGDDFDRTDTGPRVTVMSHSGSGSTSVSTGTAVAAPRVRVNVGGEELVLKGHTGLFCMRLTLHEVAGLPLPARGWTRVQTNRPLAMYHENSQETYPNPGLAETELTPEQVQTLQKPAPSYQPMQTLTQSREDRIRKAAMALGISGSVILLLLYLGVRCSGFMATAVTSERERRSWEDLALTGITPATALGGKLGGTLTLMLVQMTAAFPILLFFVFSGNIGLFAVLGLYAYAVLLAVAAGMLGLWSSARSASSHESHARALMLVLMSFTAVPILVSSMPSLLVACGVVFSLLMLVNNLQRQGVSLAWTGILMATMLTPKALSPLTAALSFLALGSSPSAVLSSMSGQVGGAEALVNWMGAMVFLGSFTYLLWDATLSRLGEPKQEVALRADIAS